MRKGLPNRPKPNGQTVPVLQFTVGTVWLPLVPCSATFVLLVTAMLTVYGWTVYSQRMWNQATQQ